MKARGNLLVSFLVFFASACVFFAGLAVAASTRITVDGIQFPDGTTQTTSASGATGQWSSSGFGIYYNSGRVGIGTDSPDGTLHLKSAGEVPKIIIESTSTSLIPNIQFKTNDATHPDPWHIGKWNVSGNMIFLHSVAPYSPVITLEYGTGNVGIGSVDPSLQERFQIDEGNVLVRGSGNFHESGDEAFVYLGDKNKLHQSKTWQWCTHRDLDER
jgi:hypothetical protein